MYFVLVFPSAITGSVAEQPDVWTLSHASWSHCGCITNTSWKVLCYDCAMHPPIEWSVIRLIHLDIQCLTFIYLPQMMSKAQRVTWLKQLNGPFPACFSSFCTRISACSFITSKKSARMVKWKVGVSIFRRWRHFCPVLLKGRETSQSELKSVREHGTQPLYLNENKQIKQIPR